MQPHFVTNDSGINLDLVVRWNPLMSEVQPDEEANEKPLQIQVLLMRGTPVTLAGEEAAQFLYKLRTMAHLPTKPLSPK